MKLFKATIRPGTVREVLENGAVKATAPGLFSFEDDINNMPPIMPWQIGSNCNSFSKPKVYDDIWIMNFADNPRQLYWFRKDRIENNKNIPITEENVESEKGIITEEINMCNDRPSDILYEEIRKNAFFSNNFKESIIGKVEDINSINKNLLSPKSVDFFAA